jgi:predicted ATPase
VVVEIYGGPGTGKTTFSAELYGALKRTGLHVTLVTEEATTCIQANDMVGLTCQAYLLGASARRLRQVATSYDVVVMEAPLLLNPVYDRDRSPALRALAEEEHRRYRNLPLLLSPLPREQFTTAGRVHDADSAATQHQAIETYLEALGINPVRLPAERTPELRESVVQLVQSARTLHHVGGGVPQLPR